MRKTVMAVLALCACDWQREVDVDPGLDGVEVDRELVVDGDQLEQSWESARKDLEQIGRRVDAAGDKASAEIRQEWSELKRRGDTIGTDLERGADRAGDAAERQVQDLRRDLDAFNEKLDGQLGDGANDNVNEL